MRVAHALDWKKVSGAVLSLHFGKDSIDLAITSHPSLDKCVQPLPSIPLKKFNSTKNNKSKTKKTLHPSVVEELQDLVEDWDVCGFVVSWPVQKEGRCGAQCGRVLHTLDQIVAASCNTFNQNRPVCLWDSNHIPASNEDEWGRSAMYGRTPTSDKTIHYASVEQYQDEGAIAAEIAADYMRHFFPELQQHYSDILESTLSSSNHVVAQPASGNKAIPPAVAAAVRQQLDISWLDAAYEQTDACCASAAL